MIYIIYLIISMIYARACLLLHQYHMLQQKKTVHISGCIISHHEHRSAGLVIEISRLTDNGRSGEVGRYSRVEVNRPDPGRCRSPAKSIHIGPRLNATTT